MIDYIRHYEEMIAWHTKEIEWYCDQIGECNMRIKQSQEYDKRLMNGGLK